MTLTAFEYKSIRIQVFDDTETDATKAIVDDLLPQIADLKVREIWIHAHQIEVYRHFPDMKIDRFERT